MRTTEKVLKLCFFLGKVDTYKALQIAPNTIKKRVISDKWKTHEILMIDKIYEENKLLMV